MYKFFSQFQWWLLRYCIFPLIIVSPFLCICVVSLSPFITSYYYLRKIFSEFQRWLWYCIFTHAWLYLSYHCFAFFFWCQCCFCVSVSYHPACVPLITVSPFLFYLLTASILTATRSHGDGLRLSGEPPAEGPGVLPHPGHRLQPDSLPPQ